MIRKTAQELLRNRVQRWTKKDFLVLAYATIWVAFVFAEK
jgi:hypothetical protein